ncbi:MAG: acyl-CoA synthetase FdrA [Eubacteriales bacterium]|jgi:succinyl-CoA synthetase alpha subunit|nr:acyl-CoA synthetase FdrA [Eubacteriales bacterium]MDD3540376.1 acyl-CoA synthetase FdrA [Eubacteriales bacterium]MDD4186532.1 acyl-CoA synthetase FdrA [Eubacteriales bacterium]
MIKAIVRENAYYDSVTLMLISREMKKQEGVEEVLVGMGTDLNLDLVKMLDMFVSELEQVTPNDLFIAAKFDENLVSMDELVASFDEQINSKKEAMSGDYQPPTLSSAIRHLAGANLVQISIPGQYAGQEAETALNEGLHVMMFSDNVPVEEELKLKKMAVEKGLLMMGPDCGTAIINGVPLCFANAVRRGKIGLVGASGTGTQEITVIIHKLGEGLSQVIGTGGRDLREEIGGLMMIQGIEALIADPETEVIVLVSKPPAPSVEKKIYDLIKDSPKPVVIDFIGGDAESVKKAGAISCVSLEDAAKKAVALLRKETPVDFDGFDQSEEAIDALVKAEVAKLKDDQKYLVALFTGGTLTDEAIKYLGEDFPLYSNIPLTPDRALSKREGKGHICLDLGEDEFTRGRPHPMIDPMTRTEFFKSHVDGTTAVILADVVLGYGSHEDPAGAVADSITEIKEALKKEGKDVIAVASVTGTDQDPQDLVKSTKDLEKAGVIVMPSNAQAVRLVHRIMTAAKL